MFSITLRHPSHFAVILIAVVLTAVIPAKAGIHYSSARAFGNMDPRLRGDDSSEDHSSEDHSSKDNGKMASMTQCITLNYASILSASPPSGFVSVFSSQPKAEY